MTWAHNMDHKSSVGTLARSRSHVWIHHGRGLAQSIARSCIVCCIEKAKLTKQKMGQLPIERMATRSLPWAAICLDLLSPVMVKAMVNKRSHMKAWPLLMVCQVTGTIHLEVMHDYTISTFLLQWRRFVALRGVLALVVSDQGSQLISKENEASVSWKSIEESGAALGTR